MPHRPPPFLALFVAIQLCAGTTSMAVCMWAEVEGERLGTVGRTTGEYSTAVSTVDRTIELNTQATGQAVFFGYVANKVRLTRSGHGGRPHVYDVGTVAREMTGGGWTKHGDLSGKHTYQPSWMVMQSPLVTRIYACQPHKGKAGDYRMSGGQGAEWSTSPQPWINDVKLYSDNLLRMEVTGYGVVFGGVNRNHVTLIDADDRWPCEIMKDFALPTGALAIRSAQSGSSVDIEWDTRWGCGIAPSSGPQERTVPTQQNRAPSVTLAASPSRGEPTLTTTFTASAQDPDGDRVEYRFQLPDGTWTPWGPSNAVTTKLSSVGTHTAKVEVTDIKGAPASGVATVKVEEREVYIFGNLVYPVSTARSASMEADYSVTLAQEFLKQGNFGGIFGRLSPEAKTVSEKYGGMFGKMVVIDTAGELVGVYNAQNFTGLNSGFQETVYDWTKNYNSYKGKVAQLPDGQRLRVKENAMASPLIVDMDGNGIPSLLAGRGWKTPREFSPSLTDYRKVDLDGKGPQWWEWVGPDDALLVDATQVDSGVDKVAHFVFGNATWGKEWNHGFEPLAELDRNASGTVEGEELLSLGLWTDRNGNAVADKGEILPLSESDILSISVRPDSNSPKGNYMAGNGVTRRQGTTSTAWDWWSARSPLSYLVPRGRVEWSRGPVPGLPRFAVVQATEEWKDGSLEMYPSGVLSFYTDEQGSWFVRTTASSGEGAAVDMLYPVNVAEEYLGWSVVSGSTGVNNHLFWAGDRLVGITVMNDGRYSTWSAEVAGGDIPLPRPSAAE